MHFLKGQRVTHHNKPDWGFGEVLDDSSDEKVRIFFEHGGERTLHVADAQLDLVNGDSAESVTLDSLRVRPCIDIEKNIRDSPESPRRNFVLTN